MSWSRSKLCSSFERWNCHQFVPWHFNFDLAKQYFTGSSSVANQSKETNEISRLFCGLDHRIKITFKIFGTQIWWKGSFVCSQNRHWGLLICKTWSIWLLLTNWTTTHRIPYFVQLENEQRFPNLLSFPRWDAVLCQTSRLSRFAKVETKSDQSRNEIKY